MTSTRSGRSRATVPIAYPLCVPLTRSASILYPRCRKRNASGTFGDRGAMRDSEWLDKDDAALEQLLVERWLYRGGMLAVILLSAVLTTYLGIRGVSTLADTLTLGALLGLALAAAVVAFVMRLVDLRIHRELRRRGRDPRRPGRGSG